jgi:hypothetical protein
VGLEPGEGGGVTLAFLLFVEVCGTCLSGCTVGLEPGESGGVTLTRLFVEVCGTCLSGCTVGLEPGGIGGITLAILLFVEVCGGMDDDVVDGVTVDIEDLFDVVGGFPVL